MKMSLKDNWYYDKDNDKEKIEYIKNFLDELREQDKGIENIQISTLANLFIFPPNSKDREDMSGEDYIIKRTKNGYKTGNIMGFIGCGNDSLVITSRFKNKNDNKDYFLTYLLGKVFDCPNLIDMKIGTDNGGGFRDLFAFIFPYYLKNAMKKGLLRDYVTKKYNDSNVKGVIDIPRHIKLNTPFLGKIAYNRREYAGDNYMTELIRHTIEYIKAKPYGKAILASVRDEVRDITNVTGSYRQNDREKIINANIKKTVAHAYYHEYRDLQRICIMILKNRPIAIGKGKNQVYGILFDGAWLWEEYINTVVKDMFYHPENKAGKGAQYLFNGGTGKIYPDFIGKGDYSNFIGDAKYKTMKNIGKGNKDYFQILSYMFRFEANTGIFFYPGSEDKVLYLKDREDKKVIKLGFKIPSKGTYSEFVKAMQIEEQKLNEKEFKKTIKAVCEQNMNKS